VAHTSRALARAERVSAAGKDPAGCPPRSAGFSFLTPTSRACTGVRGMVHWSGTNEKNGGYRLLLMGILR
jgi:hypothetical protein